MAISVVQSKGASSVTSSTTIVVTFDSASTTGNAIKVGVLWFDTGDHTCTISDSKSNSYSSSYARVNGSALADAFLQQFHAENITGGGAAIAVTATFSGSNAEKYIIISETSGLATSAMLDQAASQASSTAATGMSSTATPTTTQADELLYGCAGQLKQVIAITAETDWTLVLDQGQLGCQYRIVSATAAYTSTPVQSVTENYVSGIATFKAAAASGTYEEDAFQPFKVATFPEQIVMVW